MPPVLLMSRHPRDYVIERFATRQEWEILGRDMIQRENGDYDLDEFDDEDSDFWFFSLIFLLLGEF